MAVGLTFSGLPPSTPTFTKFKWVAIIGIVLCIASIVMLTLLLPSGDTYAPNGGFIPIAPSGQTRG